jgi:Plasma-membrane choline transporter
MEASSFCSRALTDSMTRALTYSFGSICFGSFLVSFVQALRALEHHSRDSEDLQILSCIIQCILSWYVGRPLDEIDQNSLLTVDFAASSQSLSSSIDGLT